MAATPRLLVITPTLGRSPYLENCVVTTKRLQLETLHIISCPAPAVAELQERFPECRVIADGGQQGGMYEAINAGLKEHGGETDWFTYINDDDELTPGFAEMFARFARPENEAKIAYGDVRYIDATGKSLGLMPTERTASHFIPLLLSGITPLTQQGTLVGPQVMKAIGLFDSSFRQIADLDFWVRCMLAGVPFLYHPLEVSHFRLHLGQLSSNRAQVNEERDILLQRLEAKNASLWQQFICRMRFRVRNAPRYVERVRTVGWVSSEEMMTHKVLSLR